MALELLQNRYWLTGLIIWRQNFRLNGTQTTCQPMKVLIAFQTVLLHLSLIPQVLSINTKKRKGSKVLETILLISNHFCIKCFCFRSSWRFFDLECRKRHGHNCSFGGLASYCSSKHNGAGCKRKLVDAADEFAPWSNAEHWIFVESVIFFCLLYISSGVGFWANKIITSGLSFMLYYVNITIIVKICLFSEDWTLLLWIFLKRIWRNDPARLWSPTIKMNSCRRWM